MLIHGTYFWLSQNFPQRMAPFHVLHLSAGVFLPMLFVDSIFKPMTCLILLNVLNFVLHRCNVCSCGGEGESYAV